MNPHPFSRAWLARYGIAWLPIPIFLAAILGLWVADVRVPYPSPALRVLLYNYGAGFIGIVLIIIPAARSFLANGQAGALMLGSAVLMTQIATGAMAAGMARSTSAGFAIYNTSVLLSALCHFAGVTIVSRHTTRLRHRAAWLTAAYAVAATAMGLIASLAFTGRMPGFFIEGEGGTLLRSLVVGTAVVLFGLTAALLWQANLRTATPFLYWYALALALLAIGLAGSTAIAVPDSPLHWVTRSTQLCAMVYMCVAVLAPARESGPKGMSLAPVEDAWPDNTFLAGLRQHTPRGWLLSNGLAVAAVALAFAGYRGATAWVGPGLPPFITFYPAVMVVALLGGLWPGLAATASAVFVSAYWILHPAEELSIASRVDRLSLAIFAGMGLFISVMSELYQRARNKAAAYDREAALRETRREKELLANFLEHASQPFAVGYADGRLGRRNHAFEELTGYSAAELGTLDWSVRLTPPEWREMEQRKLEKLQRTGQPVRYEKEYIRKNGSRVPIELLVHVACDARGKPDYYYSFLTDITERKRAEEELRRNREWLSVTLSSIGDGVIACDADGRITFVNPVAASLAGWDAGEALGQPIQRVFHIISEATRQPAEDLVARVLEERRPVALANHTSLVARDGHEVPIEDSAAPILDGAGNLAGVVIVFHDVTENRRAQETLRQSEEQYRSLFRNMAEGFALHEIVTDPDGVPCDYRFLDVNPGFERLTGLTAAGLIGRTVREAMPGIEPQWIEAYGKVALTGQPATFESFAAPLDRWYEVFAYRPAARRFAVIFMDVTARRAAEHRLREAQKLESIGLLAGGIAHDFNNLLVGVIGNASLAQEMIPPDDPAADLLGGVLKTGEQLAHLTRQMLAYSGQGRFYLEPLNLSDIVPEMLTLVQPSIPGKIELRLELERGLPPLEADRGQMQQVFMNLVLNAAEAIGVNAGLITVTSGLCEVDGQALGGLPPGKYIRLEVRDTGCGMDDQTKAKIFDPFFSTKFVGRGLGLAAVSGIVRGHEGAITVTSAPGQGSCFSVLLPVAETAAAVAPVTPSAMNLSGSGTILVVDDEGVVREIAKHALERHGYHVLAADSGLAAIDVAKRHPGNITLILLDLSMPGMGGEEVLPELRKIRPNTRVVVSSGYSEAETMRLFAGQSVAGFLQKPFTSNGLAEKVKSALS
jgi:PAS domain S-box-containing protein